MAWRALHLVKRVLIGPPRPTSALRTVALPKWLALPVFSADPLSSVAYATEQMMIVLFAASIAGRDLVIPLSLAVAALLALVLASYGRARAVTRHPGAVAAVLLPEVVPGGRLGRVVEDRRSLYVKWLLLHEPRTVLSSIPYHLISAPTSPPRDRARAPAAGPPRR